ncbi:MAG: alpha/beta hydrolase [Treponema sp.]|nr:alpha/beta hydrolase [Treponema sp.]
MKLSIRYRLVRLLFKILRVNKLLDKQGEDFQKLLERYREKQKIPLKVPYGKLKGFIIEEKNVAGTNVFVVCESGVKPKNAVLYLFGGGYILPPDPGDLVLCAQIAKNCGAEVWFPLYPMAPENRLVQTVGAVVNVYAELLKTHTAENVRFFGTSSGGGLALSVCMFIRHEKVNLPLPQKLVLQSPGLQIPPSKSQREKMDSLAKRDVMIPPRFFDSIAPVLATGDEAYLLSPLLFDLAGFPQIDLFYGTHEVMFAYLFDMVDACKKYGVPLNVHIGQDMMHCWGAMEAVPEAKAVRKEYFAALK